LTGFLRVIVAIGGGWLALRLTGSLNWLFAALAFGMIVYGVALTAAITSGAWFGRERTINARGYPRHRGYPLPHQPSFEQC
jgi:hypothetical protein